MIQAAAAKSAAAADVVSTATESTATPSSHEAEVTSTDPSPASTTIFSTATATTTATAAAGLCLDKMCQWLLGWLLGSCDCFFLCMLVERKCKSLSEFVCYWIQSKSVFGLQVPTLQQQQPSGNNQLLTQNNSALQQQQLLQQQILQQAKQQQQQAQQLVGCPHLHTHVLRCLGNCLCNLFTFNGNHLGSLSVAFSLQLS